MNLLFFFSVPLTLAAAAVIVANSDVNDVSEVKKAFDTAHVRIIILLKTIKRLHELYLDSGRSSHYLRPEDVAWSDIPSVRIAISHYYPSRNAAFQRRYATF
jgi:hypothetical protein